MDEHVAVLYKTYYHNCCCCSKYEEPENLRLLRYAFYLDWLRGMKRRRTRLRSLGIRRWTCWSCCRSAETASSPFGSVSTACCCRCAPEHRTSNVTRWRNHQDIKTWREWRDCISGTDSNSECCNSCGVNVENHNFENKLLQKLVETINCTL